MYTCASVFVFIIKKRLNHARTETEMAHHRVLNWWIPELNIRFMIMMKTMMTSSRVFAFGGRNFHYFFFEAVNLSLKSPPPKKKPINVEMTKRSQYICESIVYPLSSMVIIFCVLSQRKKNESKSTCRQLYRINCFDGQWMNIQHWHQNNHLFLSMYACLNFFFILLILFLTVMMMMMMMVAVHPVSSSSSSYI